MLACRKPRESAHYLGRLNTSYLLCQLCSRILLSILGIAYNFGRNLI